MKMGLFGKIFLYTLLFLTLIVGAFSWFYAEHFQTALVLYEREQQVRVLQPLIWEIEQDFREDMNIAHIAEMFVTYNVSPEFAIRNIDENIVFETENFQYFPDAGRNFGIMRSTNLHGITFTTAHDLQAHTISIVSMAANEDLIYVSRIIPLIITLLIASVVCAYMLARLIAKPIKKLAHDTKMMTNLMDIDPPPARRDEIGQLAQDVHGMYKQLKHIMENQRGFFSAASHELKTPIAGTTAIIEAMMEGLIDQDEYPAYLEQCLGMMNNQSELISEILEIVRYNDGRIKPNIESFELAPFVLSMLPTYEAIAARKEQSININIPQDQTIRADKTLLSKVMSNVLMNAITNAPERSEIRLWSENGFLYILNTNTHISEEELPRLFEPFYRTDKARTSGDGGNSGLGLAIVKKALDTMQIPFGLENSADGVIFWLDVR